MSNNTCDVLPGLPELQDASFRGIPFYVSREMASVGRRIVTQQFPNRDDPYNEDLGEKPQDFKVSAYVYGANGDNEVQALRAACRQKGPGPLILPTTPSVNVVCLDMTFTRSLEKIDWYEIEMSFRVDPKKDTPQTVVVSQSNILAAQDDLVVAKASNYLKLSTTLSTAANQVTMAQRIQDFAATVVSVLEKGVVASRALVNSNYATVGALLDPLNSVLAATSNLSYSAQLALSDAQFQISLLTGTASDVVQAAGELFSYAQHLANGNSDGSPRADVIPAVATVLGGLSGAMNPQDAYTAYQGLATFSSVPAPTAIRCQADQDDILNEHAFCSAVRQIALGHLARTLATYPFETRAEAVQARADFVELCDNELATIQQQASYTTWTWPETTAAGVKTITFGGATPTVGTVVLDFNDQQSADALTTCRDIAVQMISQNAASLDQVITVEANASLPAIWWAYRLNQTPEQAAALITQNAAVDGNFMPTTFQAEING